MNRIIPCKFLGFSSLSSKVYNEKGYKINIPQDYYPIPKEMGINLVVKLKKPS